MAYEAHKKLLLAEEKGAELQQRISTSAVIDSDPNNISDHSQTIESRPYSPQAVARRFGRQKTTVHCKSDRESAHTLNSGSGNREIQTREALGSVGVSPIITHRKTPLLSNIAIGQDNGQILGKSSFDEGHQRGRSRTLSTGVDHTHRSLEVGTSETKQRYNEDQQRQILQTQDQPHPSKTQPRQMSILASLSPERNVAQADDQLRIAQAQAASMSARPASQRSRRSEAAKLHDQVQSMRPMTQGSNDRRTSRNSQLQSTRFHGESKQKDRSRHNKHSSSQMRESHTTNKNRSPFNSTIHEKKTQKKKVNFFDKLVQLFAPNSNKHTLSQSRGDDSDSTSSTNSMDWSNQNRGINAVDSNTAADSDAGDPKPDILTVTTAITRASSRTNADKSNHQYRYDHHSPTESGHSPRNEKSQQPDSHNGNSSSSLVFQTKLRASSGDVTMETQDTALASINTLVLDWQTRKKSHTAEVSQPRSSSTHMPDMVHDGKRKPRKQKGRKKKSRGLRLERTGDADVVPSYGRKSRKKTRPLVSPGPSPGKKSSNIFSGKTPSPVAVVAAKKESRMASSSGCKKCGAGKGALKWKHCDCINT